MSSYAGIDYSHGMANVNHETGIHYGVIHQGEILQAWADRSEPDYGDPGCPECGGAVQDTSAEDFDDAACPVKVILDYYCPRCQECIDSQDAWGDEALSFSYEGDGYLLSQSGGDSDVFVLKSPYFTHAQYCSPCAPGAGYLTTPCPDGPKTYCLGHTWFWDTDEKCAPYPVYAVATGELVAPPAA